MNSISPSRTYQISSSRLCECSGTAICLSAIPSSAQYCPLVSAPSALNTSSAPKCQSARPSVGLSINACSCVGVFMVSSPFAVDDEQHRRGGESEHPGKPLFDTLIFPRDGEGGGFR